jgi:hypothetical protein
MASLTVQDWGAVGELIGAVAVIVTIIYLALQLKRSARATHRQTYHAAAEAIAEFSLTLARDQALNDRFRGALQTPDALLASDLNSGFAALDAYLALMESFYLHNREFGERLSQERWDRMLRRLFATPGAQRYWRERCWQFHAEFAAYVDALAHPHVPAEHS